MVDIKALYFRKLQYPVSFFKNVREVQDSVNWREPAVGTGKFLSEKAFRIRKWAVLGDRGGVDAFRRAKMGEHVETFAELDEELWTPTKECPLRGVWVGMACILLVTFIWYIRANIY